MTQSPAIAPPSLPLFTDLIQNNTALNANGAKGPISASEISASNLNFVRSMQELDSVLNTLSTEIPTMNAVFSTAIARIHINTQQAQLITNAIQKGLLA